MPYIKPEDRSRFEEPIEELIDLLHFASNKNLGRDGCANYVITSIIDGVYARKYADLNAAIGVLECVKQELYRRVVAPYEDTKIIENGDVYT